jgi:hypothetical protein
MKSYVPVFFHRSLRNLARKLFKIGIGDQNRSNPPFPMGPEPVPMAIGRDFLKKILQKTQYLQHSGWPSVFF